ncbi:MAG: hypothetical protein MHM6MM_004771, partial [Cercozoa sp. M6MM]
LSICGSITLVIIILIAVSIDSLSPTEYGLHYNANTKHIKPNKVYENGRYMLGPGHSFVKFPKKVQTLNFEGASSIEVRSYDGLPVTLSVTVNYRLSKENLHGLYYDYAKDYELAFQKIIRNDVRDSASLYNVTDFYETREAINQQMQVKVQETFLSIHGVQLDSLLVKNVKLPSEVEYAIQQTQIAIQDIQQAENELERARIDAETKVLAAEESAKVIVADANADAQAIRNKAAGEVDQVRLQASAEAESYAALKTDLNMTSDELLAFVFLEAMQETGAGSMVLDIPVPSVLSNN